MTPQPGHFDYPIAFRQMDEAGVDLAIISLACPNVYWGGRDVSLKAAQVVNDDMAGAQLAYPSRIRWLCSLPWEYPEVAVPELARAADRGAVGVMVLANIAGRPLHRPAVRAGVGGDRPACAPRSWCIRRRRPERPRWRSGSST